MRYTKLALVLLYTILLNFQVDTMFSDIQARIDTANNVYATRYSPDGQYLAFLSNIDGLSLYRRANNYQFINSTNIDFTTNNGALALSYSHDQSLIAYSAYNAGGKIIILNMNNQLTVNKTINLNFTQIYNLDFSPDDTRIIVCGRWAFSIYQISNSSIIFYKSCYNSFSCRFSKNNYYAAVVDDRNIEVFDQNYNLKYRYNGNSGQIRLIDWNSNGNAFAFAEHFKGVSIYNIATNNTSQFQMIDSSERTAAIDWSPDDKLIAFNIQTKFTIIKNAMNSKILVNISTNDVVWGLCFSPNNLYLAQTRINNKSVWIYRLQTCDLGFYQQSNQCFPCRLNCLLCDNSTCQICSSGRLIEFGCTQIIGCVQIEEYYLNTTNNCKKCDEPLGFELNQSNKTCQCKPGYRLDNNICHNIDGCIVPVFNKLIISCLVCDSQLNYQQLSDICSCKRGYKWNDLTDKCEEVCGDGLRFQYQCDDGNIDNGDGCSSKCKSQRLYKCINEDPNQGSRCFYSIKSHFNSVLIWTNRNKMRNAGEFRFQITPKLPLLSNANVSQLNFISNSVQNITWRFQNKELIVQVQYNQTLQGKQVQITFNINNLYYRGALSFNLSFTVKTNDKELLYQTQQEMNQQQNINIAFNITFYIILVLLFIESALHKMAGVQLINMYQVIIYVFLLQKKITPLKSTLQIFTYLDSSFMYFFNNDDNLNDSLNKQLACFTYYGIISVIFVIFCILTISKQLSDEQTSNLKDTIYNKFLFPFTMVFFYQLYSFSSTSVQGQAILYKKFYIVINTLFKTIAIIILTLEIKKVFFTDNIALHRIFGLKDCKRAYIFWYIICYFFTVNFIIISSIYSIQFYRQFLAIFFLLLFAIFIYALPYKQMIHNITQISNMSVLIFFLIFIGLKHRMPQLTNKQTILPVFILFTISAANVLINILRIIMMIKNKCKQKKQNVVTLDNLKEDEPQVQNRQIIYNYRFNNYEYMLTDCSPSKILTNAIDKPMSVQHKTFIENRRKLYKQQAEQYLRQTLN